MKMRTALRWGIPFVVTTAILVYLFQSIGIRAAFSEVTLGAALILFPVIVLYAALSLLIEGLSLARLTEHAGRHADLATCSRIKAASYTVGMLNYALGAAALTVLFRRRVGLGIHAAAGLVATVSVTDLAMMMLIALASAGLAAGEGPALQIGLVVGSITAVFGGLVVLRAPFSLGPLDRLRDLEVFRTVRSAPPRLLAELAVLRVCFVSTFIATGAGSLFAFDVRVPLSDLVVGMSAVALVGALPIAVSGLGTVQAAVVYLFDDWANRDTLLACSLAMQATMLVVRSCLGLFYAREFTREAVQAARAEAEA